MQLADVGLIRDRLTLPDDEKTNQTISDAIDAATIYLGEILQTDFGLNTYTDTFFIDTGIYNSRSMLFRLKLSNGFVKRSSVVVKYTPVLFDTNPQWIDLTQGPDYLVSNPEKGWIDVQDTPPAIGYGYGYRTRLLSNLRGPFVRDQFVQVSYEAGFADDLDNVPAWLQEAAFTYALKMLSVQQIGDQEPVLTKTFQMLDKHRGAVLDRHLRVTSSGIPPMMSV